MSDFIKKDSKYLTRIKAQVAARALRRATIGKDLVELDRAILNAEDLGVDKALLNAARERKNRLNQEDWEEIDSMTEEDLEAWWRNRKAQREAEKEQQKKRLADALKPPGEEEVEHWEEVPGTGTLVRVLAKGKTRNKKRRTKKFKRCKRKCIKSKKKNCIKKCLSKRTKRRR